MDVVLFAASGGLGSWLPIQNSSKQSSKSVRVALGLSFALFSLSILEVCPSQWLVLLEHDEQVGYLTITRAYEILLWIFCIGVVFVLPAGIGGHIFQMTATRSKDDKKYAKKPRGWKSPWWIRYSWQFFLLILSIFYRLGAAPLMRLMQRPEQRFQNASELPTLVATNSSSSQDGLIVSNSRHGLKAPNVNNRKASAATASAATISANVLGGIGGVVTTMVLLKTLGSLIIPAQQEHVLSTVVSWLCAVGLVISSTLNGFGSVSLPYSCLAGIFLEPIPTEVLNTAEMELRSTEKTLDSKVVELQSDSFTSVEASNPASARRRSKAVLGSGGISGGTSSKFIFADFNSDESLKRKQVLQTEIDFLDTLIDELKEDIVEMKHAQEQAAGARTKMGKIRSYVGFVFSLVLLIRLYTASMSVLVQEIGPKPKRGDPITTGLLFLTGHNLVSNHDYDTLSQGISLLLTAILSASQIRTFLRTVAAVNRRLMLIYRKCYCTPRHHHNHQAASVDDWDDSSHHRIHSRILAALTGCYFLSCVVLTKMNVPLRYRSSFAAALGGMEFSIRTPAVNLIFCASAGVSAMVLSLLFGIQRQNTKRHADESTRGVGLDV